MSIRKQNGRLNLTLKPQVPTYMFRVLRYAFDIHP